MGSQAEKRRIIELSFRNAVLIKASLFRKKYRRFFDYALFGKASEMSENIEERYFGRHLPATACCSWFTSRDRSFPASRCRGSSCRHDEQRRVPHRPLSGSPGAGAPRVRRPCRGPRCQIGSLSCRLQATRRSGRISLPSDYVVNYIMLHRVFRYT